MKFILKWLCVTCFVLAATAESNAGACGRCGYSPCRIRSRPVCKDKLAPVPTDRSFNVTYHLSFPQPAVAGSTGFAYTAPRYQFLDPALWLNSASRYLETAQHAASRGFTEANQTANLIIGQQRDLAELHARTALLQEMAKILAQTAPSKSVQFQLKASRDASGKINIESSPVPGARLNVSDIVAGKCVRCHGPNKKDGGLDLSNLSVLDKSFEAKILNRITTADANKRMPQGGSLTADEIAAFFRVSSICGGKKQ